MGGISIGFSLTPWDHASDCTAKLARGKRGGHRSAAPAMQAGETMKARVFVTLKPGVLDPQGKAIHHALEGLGFDGVNDVRAGKLIELDLADGTSDSAIEEMCRKLLANTVIENFRIERPSASSGQG
jgi:phosphoribosylformylglycinamidine synthase